MMCEPAASSARFSRSIVLSSAGVPPALPFSDVSEVGFEEGIFRGEGHMELSSRNLALFKRKAISKRPISSFEQRR
jgi:hypothetical protein